MIAIDLNNQKEIDADLKVSCINQLILLQIKRCNNGATMFFITEESKEANLNFSQGTVKVL